MMKSEITAGLCSALLLLASALPASAQVSLRVDLVAWGHPIEGLTLKGGGGSPVTAFPFSYGKSIPYNGPEIMEIHQSAAAAPAAAPATADGGEQPQVPAALAARRLKSPTLVALAKLPVGSKRATILLAPAAGGTYQTHVIDSDPSKVPVGKLSVLNLSPYRIAMRFHNGRETAQLATGETHVTSPDNSEVSYEMAYLEEEEWVVQENSLLPVAAEDQTQMIILLSESELFRSSMGTRAGHLQVVTLRKGPREPGEIIEISRAEREAAQREAERLNRQMEEQSKPENTNKSRNTQPRKP